MVTPHGAPTGTSQLLSRPVLDSMMPGRSPGVIEEAAYTSRQCPLAWVLPPSRHSCHGVNLFGVAGRRDQLRARLRLEGVGERGPAPVLSARTARPGRRRVRRRVSGGSVKHRQLPGRGRGASTSGETTHDARQQCPLSWTKCSGRSCSSDPAASRVAAQHADAS